MFVVVVLPVGLVERAGGLSRGGGRHTARHRSLENHGPRGGSSSGRDPDASRGTTSSAMNRSASAVARGSNRRGRRQGAVVVRDDDAPAIAGDLDPVRAARLDPNRAACPTALTGWCVRRRAGGGRGRRGDAAGSSPSTASNTPSWRRGRRATGSRRAAHTGSISAMAGASSSRSTTATLSASISFDPRATADADRFIAEDVVPRLASGPSPDDEPPLVVIATDGELYGHHQPFRENCSSSGCLPAGRRGRAGVRHRHARRGSAGVGRPALPDDPDLRANVVELPPRRPALERRVSVRGRRRLEGPAAGRHRTAGGGHRRRDGADDAGAWPVRRTHGRRATRYVDVVIGAKSPAEFAARWLGREAIAPDGVRLAGCGHVPEPADRAALAARDVRQRRLVLGRPGATRRPRRSCGRRRARRAWSTISRGTDLEGRLVEDLALFSSPGHGIDGAEIYCHALAEVGQPMPRGYAERRGSIESIRLSTPN